MKLILYMAMTVNGLVAGEEGDSGWIGEAHEKALSAMRENIGNIIMGRSTYEALMDAKQFPFPNCVNIVMTREAPPVDPIQNVVFTDKAPEEVLEDLEKDGFESALLVGGGELSGSFMADGLVDEIYLTMEPLAFGEGVKLFGGGFFRRELELLDVKKISDEEVQLRYAVKRPTLEDYMGE